MRRYIYGLLIALGVFVPAINLGAPAATGAVDLFGGICSGQNDTKTNAAGTDVCKEKQAAAADKQNPIIHVISIAISIVAFIVGIASVIIIVISGFKLVTSRGDAQSVATARSAIIYAVIGVAIALMAATIVSIVLNNL